MSKRFEDWLYEALGTDWCGNTGVPCDNMTIRWLEMGKESVAAVGNDGFELYLGAPSHWYWTIRREHARKLAWFILWNWWIAGEWFGLRRCCTDVASEITEWAKHSGSAMRPTLKPSKTLVAK